MADKNDAFSKGAGALLLVDPALPESEYDITQIPKKASIWKPQPAGSGGYLPPMREYSAGALHNNKYYIIIHINNALVKYMIYMLILSLIAT